MRCILVVFLFLFFISCKHERSAKDLTELPQVSPVKTTEFSSAGDFYFGFLGVTTIPLDDGSILIPDRQQNALIQVNESGAIIKQLTGVGRGPGEVEAVTLISKTIDDHILLYDQSNKKILRYDDQLSYLKESLLEPYGSGALRVIHQLGSDDNYMMQFDSFAYIFDQDLKPEMYLAAYDGITGKYTHSDTLQSREYARLIVDDQIRGGRQVPHTPQQLLTPNRENASVFIYWTGSPLIAEINHNFDTLRTIEVALTAEALSNAERRSVQEESRSEQWLTMRNLLPEYKTPVENMLTDDKDRIWLQLNYSGETQQWLILNTDGTKEKVVHLPVGSMLTHISEHHLGVRMDDATFALFEPVD